MYYRQIKFVRPKQVHEDKKIQSMTTEIPLAPEDDGVYLFTDSNQRLSTRDILESDLRNGPNNPMKRMIREMKKRKLQDEDESDDENTKLKSVAVSSDWVISGKY